VTLYDYGPMAWLWRCMILLFGALASLFLVGGLSPLNPLVMGGAIALLAPAVFFGTVLVVRADRGDGGGLEIQTLLFWRRRIARDRLGAPRVRIKYRTEHTDLSAPRVWVPVKGGWPLYFDLLGRIPDRPAFLAAIKLSASAVRVAE